MLAAVIRKGPNIDFENITFFMDNSACETAKNPDESNGLSRYWFASRLKV